MRTIVVIKVAVIVSKINVVVVKKDGYYLMIIKHANLQNAMKHVNFVNRTENVNAKKAIYKLMINKNVFIVLVMSAKNVFKKII